MSGPVGLTVPASLAGVRIDRAVAALTGMSRSEVAQRIGAGDVRLDGAIVGQASRPVRVGSRIDLNSPDPVPAGPIQGDSALVLAVVYEDEDIAVIDKPAGLVVHPGAGTAAGTLVNGLVARYPAVGLLVEQGVCDPARPGIVHRLDKGTSGLMVAALSERSFHSLTAKIAGREVRRIYTVLGWGAFDDDEAIIDAPVGRSARDRTLMAVSAAGKPAVTRFRVETRFASPVSATLLTATLDSGRTHQIRVHLSALGHPVVGDSRYGGGITRRRDPGGTIELDRPFLHAAELAFAHPVSGKPLSFTSPLPSDLERVLSLLSSGVGG